MTFHDGTFGKGFIDDNGILVGLERYSSTLSDINSFILITLANHLLSDFVGHCSQIK